MKHNLIIYRNGQKWAVAKRVQNYIIIHYIIIQLTPHWGFSVTDYIKYYAYAYVTYQL